MEVVAFKKTDVDAVFAIQQAAYLPLYEKYHDEQTNPYMESKETVLRKYTSVGTYGYVFKKDGILVGAVRIYISEDGKTGRVSALAVDPGYQGQGVAQKALRQIEKMHQDVTKWTLDTILQETGNCYLYEKLGYRKTGKTEQLKENMTLVYYEK